MTAEVLHNKSDQELLDSLLAEIAKSSNEVQCGLRDLNKIQSRLSFALVLLNELKQRNNHDDR